jgi:hypothetical protein
MQHFATQAADAGRSVGLFYRPEIYWKSSKPPPAGRLRDATVVGRVSQPGEDRMVSGLCPRKTGIPHFPRPSLTTTIGAFPTHPMI